MKAVVGIVEVEVERIARDPVRGFSENPPAETVAILAFKVVGDEGFEPASSKKWIILSET